MRKEINTPICFEEKQHLVSICGKFFDVFSFVKDGKRVFKCRKSYANESEALKSWEKICANYS